jgi:hypothetical protein
MLLEKPDIIGVVLDAFGFANIDMRQGEIRCGRDDGANRSSIRIKLTKNEKLYVQDFAKNKSCDIFTYIIQEKNVTFKDVITFVNSQLGIYNICSAKRRTCVFDGFYNKTRKRRVLEPLKTYSESVLSEYHMAYSKRFHDDNISFDSQKTFGIRYDVNSQRIVIPIYNAVGELVGVKGRANWEISEDEEKYLYLIPCRSSETLYGYCVNYQDMTDNDVYVCESEKSVMQAYSYGMKNFVGLGGNAIHNSQCKMLTELLPKRVVFLLDEGLDMDVTTKNIEILLSFTRMLDVGIGYWDYKKSKVPSKKCPTDLGKEKLQEILRHDIVYVR